MLSVYSTHWSSGEMRGLPTEVKFCVSHTVIRRGPSSWETPAGDATLKDATGDRETTTIDAMAARVRRTIM